VFICICKYDFHTKLGLQNYSVLENLLLRLKAILEIEQFLV
jgi:hypothetical protein